MQVCTAFPPVFAFSFEYLASQRLIQILRCGGMSQFSIVTLFIPCTATIEATWLL